ncbi:MAG: polysaccharide biosynthesis C-terminal domain-containing protein [Bacteroidales bacterium]|nr:polysaccharide biosynthesis C-terminal domain-containing protein [Bacteroidales bacterium]
MIDNKVVKDTFWNILDYASSLGIFLITTKILLEQIGTDGYGFYMFFTSMIATFGLVDLGMGMAVSKYLSEFLHQKKYDEANQVITIGFAFYILIGLSLFLIVFSFKYQIIDFLNFEDMFLHIGTKILLITSIVFIINMISSIMINTLVALEEWKKISVINILLKILNAIFLVFILLYDITLVEKIYFVFILILGFSILKLFVYFIFVKSSFPNLSFSKPHPEIKEKILKFLKVSSLQYGLSLFVGHLDKFIISKFFGLEALGVYSFVVNAFVYLYGFLANIFKIYLPKLSKLHGNKNYKMLEKSFKSLLLYSLMVAIALAFFSIVLWVPFISIYIDEEFANKSYLFMQLFTLYLVVRSAEPIFAYFFNSIAKPSVLVINLVIGSISTIIGYFIFIPYLDIPGLILSQILSNCIVYGYNFYMIRKRGFYEFTR